MCDRRTGTVVGHLSPLDKTRNAEAVRRPLTPAASAPAAPGAGVAPLLDVFLRQYRATGLPPAYLPKDESDPKE